MKVVAPSPLLTEAADVLRPVRDDVVVVGAAALEVALAQSAVTITPTRDVDVVVPTERAAGVVAHLESVSMERSEEAHERDSTWVRGDLKVQLVRTFHPFPKPPAKALPHNSAFGMTRHPSHRVQVAFADAPGEHRLTCAGAGCLLALKEAAFGRTRAPDASSVERDYHDAFLLVDVAVQELLADLRVAEYEVRQRASRAMSELAAGADVTAAAARQMVRLDPSLTQRRAEAAVRRAAVRIQRQLDDRARI